MYPLWTLQKVLSHRGCLFRVEKRKKGDFTWKTGCGLTQELCRSNARLTQEIPLSVESPHLFCKIRLLFFLLPHKAFSIPLCRLLSAYPSSCVPFLPICCILCLLPILPIHKYFILVHLIRRSSETPHISPQRSSACPLAEAVFYFIFIWDFCSPQLIPDLIEPLQICAYPKAL